MIPQPDFPSDDRPARRWPARLRRWSFDLAIVVIVIAAASAWQERNLLPRESEPAPELTLRTLSGERVHLEDFAGRPVQLHFWATWCGVCRRQHGALRAAHRAAERGDGVVLAIAVDSGDLADVRAYVEEHALDYPILVGGDDVTSRYRVRMFPTNYWLDRSHRIVARDVGWTTRWAMRWHLYRAGR